MRNKSVFLLLACVCGTIAAIGVSQWMQAQNPEAIEMVEIFVTTKTINVAEEITPDKIRLEEWPANRIPEGSARALEHIEGKYARQRFYAGEPVMPVKLMNDANGTSQTIPKNYSVVSMKADPENAVANLVRPGDRVNVMAYFTKGDVIPETMAKMVLKGVRVFAVDGRTERDDDEGGTQAARTVSLLIHSKDAEAWTYASELGKVRLTLGNPGDHSNNSDSEGDDAAQEFLTWLADHQRAQQERLRAEREKNTDSFAGSPSNEKNGLGHTIVKIGPQGMTEYRWVEGQMVPVVVSETGRGSKSKQDASDLFSSEPNDDDQNNDYGHLNGASSPFFQPPKEGSSEEDDASNDRVSTVKDNPSLRGEEL